MKKLTATLIASLFYMVSYAQIPSINETPDAISKTIFFRSEKVKKFKMQTKDLKSAKENIEARINSEGFADSLSAEDSLKLNDTLNRIDIEIEGKQNLIRKYTNPVFDATFPTFNEGYRPVFFKAMYDKDSKTKYLNSFVLAADQDGAVVQSEMITDNMGPLRVAFGTVVTSPSDAPEETNDAGQKANEETPQAETGQEAFKRLINGGGNFYLELVLPMLTTNPNNGNQVTAYLYASTRGAMDIKGFGNNIDTSTGNISTGLNAYVGVSSDADKKFNFFMYANANYVLGSDEFYQNLGLANEKPFFNAKLTFGMTLMKTFKISAIVNNFGSDEKLRSGKVLIGVQILPEI